MSKIDSFGLIFSYISRKIIKNKLIGGNKLLNCPELDFEINNINKWIDKETSKPEDHELLKQLKKYKNKCEE